MTYKPALECLREAKELIATPDKWTTKSYAKNVKGEARLYSEKDAVCWCVAGALHLVIRTNGATSTAHPAFGYLGKASMALYGTTYLTVNDHEGFEAVHKVLDHAIALVEQESNV